MNGHHQFDLVASTNIGGQVGRAGINRVRIRANGTPASCSDSANAHPRRLPASSIAREFALAPMLFLAIERNRLASRAHDPRRRDCGPGRARQALRSRTPSARATADRHGSRRRIGCCRIAHRTSWHANMDDHGTFCERKEISRFGKVLSGRKRTVNVRS
jgi:hypothetical protein